MQLVRCPICEKLFDPDNSPAMPFCSERCRYIDLGRWLDQRYALPGEQTILPDERKPGADDQ